MFIAQNQSAGLGFGLTLYRAFGIEADYINLSKYAAIFTGNKKTMSESFISFESINNVCSGLLTPIWCKVDFNDSTFFYDGIGISFKLLRLKTDDILEVLKAHGELTYFKITDFGLRKASVEKSILQGKSFALPYSKLGIRGGLTE